MEPASAAPGTRTVLRGGMRCWLSGPGRVRQRRRTGLSAVPASVSWSILCHTSVTSTPQSAVPEPAIRPWRPSPLALAFSSRSPSPRSPPGGCVGVRPLRAPRSHRPVGPGLPCSRLSPPCLAPRRVRLLSSEPLCWRPTPHTHADPGPYPRPQCSPPSSQCSSDTPGLFLPEDVSPRAAFRTSFPSGLLISTKMSPPPQGHPSIIQSKITIIHFLLYHSILFLCIKYLNIRY